MKPDLPASVETFVVHDRSETITNSVNDAKQTLYIAFGLVVVVVFTFLGRVKDTIIRWSQSHCHSLSPLSACPASDTAWTISL
jgi:multidrug efflux pump subunit AcrB